MANSGSGDRLASGAPRATFMPPVVSQKRWDDTFGDFDPEEYRKKADMQKSEGTEEIGKVRVRI